MRSWIECYIEVRRREEGVVVVMAWAIRRLAAAETAAEKRAEDVKREKEDFQDSVESNHPHDENDKDNLG